MFCPTCPALLVLVKYPDDMRRAHIADPCTGARGDLHICHGR
jgi:hypothetical protein